MKPIAIPVLVMAGITLYVGFYHFMIYSRRRDLKVNLSFSILCLTMGVYDLLCSGLYNSGSFAEGVIWQHRQFQVIPFLGLSLLFFIRDYTGLKLNRLYAVVFTFFSICAVVALLGPLRLTLDVAKPIVKVFDILGFQITYYEAALGIIAELLSVSGGLMFLLALAASWMYFTKSPDKRARSLLIALVIMFIGLFNDIAVSANSYNFIYTLEYSYMAVVFLMTGELTGELVEASRIKKALRESEHRLRSLIDNSTALIYAKDIEGRYIFINRRFQDLLGLENEQIIGKTAYDLFPKQEAEQYTANHKKALRQNKPIEIDETAHVNGEVHNYLSTFFPLHDEEKVTYAICTVATDITERKMSEQKLMRAYQDLKEADELKNNFLSNISHELRTPLVAIKGYVELVLKYQPDKEKARDWLQTSIISCNRLETIIGDLLAISQLHLRNVEFHIEPVNIYDLIGKTVSEIKPQAAEKGIEIKADLVAGDYYILADRKMLQTVFSNLAGNAIKFSGLDSELKFTSTLENDKIIISVIDQGIGIDPAYHEKIFARFFQVDSSSTRLYGGSGIGLSLVKEIVEAHSGTVQIESDLGEGSTFRITFPLDADETISGASDSDQFAETDNIENRGSDLEILVIDNDRDVLDLMVAAFTDRRENIITAAGAEEGLALLQKTKPDMIFLDIAMPGTNGIEVCRIIKKDKAMHDVPVYMFSALTADAEKEQATEAGADGYIDKPFSLELIDEILLGINKGKKTDDG